MVRNRAKLASSHLKTTPDAGATMRLTFGSGKVEDVAVLIEHVDLLDTDQDDCDR